jgi:hypothetical protein
VKHLRTFILILLTVLLPIRGAVAAAVLCPGEATTLDAGMNAVHGQHGVQGEHAAAAENQAVHDHSSHPSHSSNSHGDEHNGTSSGGHATACQFCAGGGCCVTPLAFAPPSLELPRLIASATFPVLIARVTAFYPDGQDRPPRTI